MHVDLLIAELHQLGVNRRRGVLPETGHAVCMKPGLRSHSPELAQLAQVSCSSLHSSSADAAAAGGRPRATAQHHTKVSSVRKVLHQESDPTTAHQHRHSRTGKPVGRAATRLSQPGLSRRGCRDRACRDGAVATGAVATEPVATRPSRHIRVPPHSAPEIIAPSSRRRPLPVRCRIGRVRIPASARIERRR